MGAIAVVGLGYVGLPLAVEFGKVQKTIGFDLSPEKINSYRHGIDPTGEVSSDDLKSAKMLSITTDPAQLSQADYLVVAVPHRSFIERSLPSYMEKLQKHGCFIDVKSKFDAKALCNAGACVWRL